MNIAEGAPARYSQFTLKHASRPVSTPTVRHRIAEQELLSPGRARKGQEGPGGARKGQEGPPHACFAGRAHSFEELWAMG